MNCENLLCYASFSLQFIALLWLATPDGAALGQTNEDKIAPLPNKHFTVLLDSQTKELEIDLGELRTGKLSCFHLQLQNDTQKDLEVAEIAVSCKCIIGN